jgi:predicted regulator of Ras-like GTPase activity (Roadblock/LC7/MglB family)
MNSELKIQLDKIVNDLAKTNGIDGSLVVDGNGEVLSHHLLHDVDIELFGPMANVITSSSERLINFANHGDIERVLVESKKGKALFLHLGNVHFIVLMKNKANVGMIMISSKRASEEIIDLTKDLTPIQLEEQISEQEQEEIPESVQEEIMEPVQEKITQPEKADEISSISPVELPIEEEIPESSPTIEEQIEPIKAEETNASKDVIVSLEKPTDTDINESPYEILSEEPSDADVIKERFVIPSLTKKQKPEKTITETTTQETPTETITETTTQETPAEPKEETLEASIPVIKPPIAFPKLKKVTEIPEDEAERVDLILKIYESIFLAMSIGASKIMGVAPARGLTRKFLPVEDCRKLLDGVDVKSNSTIDFNKIKENAEKIPLSEREQSFKENFGKIINIITENYGKVMGYAAFRAMIRPEFKIINESYGHLLDDLGIKEQLHPELRDFFH